MVKRQGKTFVVDGDGDEVPEILAEEVPKEVEKLKKEHESDEYTVSISVVTKKGQKPEKIPEEFSLDFDINSIVEKYGGGKYKFTVRDANGEYVSKWTSYYANPKENVPQARQDESMNKIVEIVQAQLKASQDQIKTVQDKNDNLIGQMFTSMTNMFATLSAKNNDGKKDMSEILEMAKLLKELSGDKQTGMGDFVELVKLGMELKGSSSSEGGVVDKVISMLIDKFGDSGIAEKLVTALEAKSKGATPVRKQIESIPAVPAQPETNPPLEIIHSDNPVEIFIMTQIHDKLSSFINFAKKGSDVSIVSDYIVEQLERAEYDELKKYLEIPENLEKIFIKFPELTAYREWVLALLDDIVNFYKAEIPAEPAAKESKIENKPA